MKAETAVSNLLHAAKGQLRQEPVRRDREHFWGTTKDERRGDMMSEEEK